MLGASVATDNLMALLAQRDPDPEPKGGLDKHDGKHDAVLEALAAPGSRRVVRVVGVGAGVGHVAARAAAAKERRAGGEEERVCESGEGEEEADGGCGGEVGGWLVS